MPHVPLLPPSLPHSSVKVVPVGVSKGLKKLLQEKFPNMSRLEDISELLVKCVGGDPREGGRKGSPRPLLACPQPIRVPRAGTSTCRRAKPSRTGPTTSWSCRRPTLAAAT